MVSLIPINPKGESWSSINAFQLREDYEKGKLKGKLKEIAATLEGKHSANPVLPSL